ncbi:hypothetical protein FRC04_010651, partial [Tulasnella sp. 424]
MSSDTTSNNSNADSYAAAVKTIYELALKAEDGDAVAIENISPTQPEPVPKPKMSEEQLNKYIIFALKKVVGVVATLTGEVKSTQTDAVIDFMVKAAGIPLPKEGDTLVIEMLGEVNQRLDKILEGQEEIKQHTTRTMKIEKLTTLANTANTIWTTLRAAIELGDSQVVFDQIKRIGDSNLEMQLNAMHTAFQKRDAEGNEGLAHSLQQLYKTRLEDTSGNLTFDVQTYLWHVHQWNNAVSSVDRMATALLVLREQCRDVDAKLRNGWQQKHKEKNAAFVEDMNTKFLGDLGL